MDFKKLPFSQMLQDRRVFGIFDDVYADGTIPSETLDLIVERLEDLQA